MNKFFRLKNNKIKGKTPGLVSGAMLDL